jgi:hypothetical protein
MYMLIEAPDRSLGCLGPGQNWVLGLSRAKSFLASGQWEPFHASPTVPNSCSSTPGGLLSSKYLSPQNISPPNVSLDESAPIFMLMFSMFLSEQVVPQVKQGCYIQYHRLFRDRSRGTTYLEYWADNWMQVHKLVPGAGVLPIIAGSPPPTVANCTTKASCEATCEGNKTVFFGHLYIKTNILPRQARDKHRESTQKKTDVCCRGCDVPVGRNCVLLRG